MSGARKESDKFCLRWNDFESNLSAAFQSVREEKELYDVTVACDGGGEFQAHRLVLSACSQVLRQVICRKSQLGGNQQQQVIYLRGVNSRDLKFILSFMYQGEVSIAQDHLNSFLAVAEDLQVKGLTQNESERLKPSRDNRKDQSSSSSKPRNPTKYNNTPKSFTTSSRPVIENYGGGGGGDDDEIQEIPSVKTESYPEVSSGSQSQLMTTEETDLMYQEEEYQDQDSYTAASGGGGGVRDQIFEEGASQGIKFIIFYLIDKVVNGHPTHHDRLMIYVHIIT